MRVVILTHNEQRHFYFANRIIEETNSVVGVFSGGKHVRRRSLSSLERLKRLGRLANLRNALLNRLYAADGRRFFEEKRETEARYFLSESERFFTRHANLLIAEVSSEHGSINDEFFQREIQKLRPDVIVVMGTCIIKPPLISIAPLMLNLHTGLSPYYRGGYTNLWPFIFGEHGMFGVTVHIMSSGIDSGDIVCTARPDIEPSDTFASINCKCIILGTALMIRALSMAAHGRLRAIPQWCHGKLFYNRDFNNRIAHRYFHERERFLLRYCHLQAANCLPKDIKLVDPYESDNLAD